MAITQKINKTQLLTLSTAHLKQETRMLLSEPENNLDLSDLVVYPNAYGCFIYAELYTEEELPEDLIACLKFAKQQNCTWIKFDNDQNPIPDLKIYEYYTEDLLKNLLTEPFKECHNYETTEIIRFQNKEIYIDIPCKINPLTHQVKIEPITVKDIKNIKETDQVPCELKNQIQILKNHTPVQTGKTLDSNNYYWINTTPETIHSDTYFELIGYEKDGDIYYTLAKNLSLEKLLKLGKFYTQQYIRNDRIKRVDNNEPIDWIVLSYHKSDEIEILGYFTTKNPSQFVINT